MSVDSGINKIAIIGLGYVGLPLAVALSKHHQVVGFDVNQKRIKELRQNLDRTSEVDADTLRNLTDLNFTANIEDLSECNIFIVTVPTPVDAFKVPDLSPLIGACRSVGSVLKKHDIVVFESTVYPGVTQGVCARELEQVSGLTYMTDFFCGYSPERINPGDTEHSIDKVVKLVSGCTPQTQQTLLEMYGKVALAGIEVTSSIEVAEAAKVIENIQRDVNIALVNEFTKIFDALNLPTAEILDAAATKWNFLNFRPGLVGGHCIGVDPYYLTHVSNFVGEHPELISAARRINDNMSYYWSMKFHQAIANNTESGNKKVLLLGATFKENCPDIRNSKAFEFARFLEAFGYEVEFFDPLVSKDDVESNLPRFVETLNCSTYLGAAVLVPHRQFRDMGSKALRRCLIPGGLIFDLKCCFPAGEVDLQG